MKRVLSLLAFGVLAVAANAAEVLKYNGTGKGLTGSVSGWDSLTNDNYSWGSGTWNGQLRVQYKQDPGTYGTEFRAYCITPAEVLGSPVNPWVIDTPILINGGMSNSISDRIARLVTHGTTVVGVSDIFGGGMTNAAGAAFQLALWSIVNDNTMQPFASGLLSSNATVAGLYNGLIGVANTTSLTGSYIAFNPNPITGSQILITGTGGGGGGFTPVPEPFTMGLGLAAAGAFVRRRVKAKKIA